MTKQVQRRRGTASQHTSFTGADGELSVNTTNKSVHVHDGVTTGGIEAARADLGNVSDASLNTALAGNTLSSLTITSADINGGTIDGTTIGSASPAAITGTAITGTSFVSSGNMSFADNAKAIFGAGSDLQIYHTGGNSNIVDNGTGNLVLQTNGTSVKLQKGATETLAEFKIDDAVDLYHNNNLKLATTATGIDVTGTVTADGLTVESSGKAAALFKGYTSVTGVNAVNNGEILIGNNPSFQGRISYEGQGNGVLYIENSYSNNAADTIFRARSSGTAQNKLRIAGNGNISFYEDLGVTPKFFWDASAERLGLGTISPSAKLTISDSGSSLFSPNAYIAGATADVMRLGFDSGGARTNIVSGRDSGTSGATNGYMAFETRQGGGGMNEAMRITSTGSVGIGTSSPARQFHLHDASGDNNFHITNSTTGLLGTDGFSIVSQSTTNDVLFNQRESANLRIFTAGAERLRIDASGNLLVGRTSSSGVDTDGHVLWGNGISYQSATSNSAQFINRNGTDGAITTFYKNGASVGSIGTIGGDIGLTTGPNGRSVYLGGANSGGSARHLYFDLDVQAGGSSSVNEAGAFYPSLDNGTDLGTNGQRFHDLYLSGGLRGDTLTFSNLAGSERMRITSTGSVGIGTAAPAAPLHVKVATNANFTAQNTGGIVQLQAINDAANAFTQLDLAGNPITFSANGAERMRITSTGSVGIGTSSPSATLDVAGTVNAYGNGNVSLQWGNTSALGSLSFDGSANPVIRSASSKPLVFQTDGANERLRIDASGNLLVGKTAINSTAVGAELRPTGLGVFVRDGGEPIYANRLTSDGDIIKFGKNSTTVGSIGSVSGVDMYIGKGTTGLRFYNGNNADGGTGIIVPWNVTANSARDDQMNLGSNTERFRNLYLSGGVYLGGTGAANKLDDYEEGTWTPTVTSGSILSVNSSTYTKVGNTVSFQVDMVLAGARGTEDFHVGGLPFVNVSTRWTACPMYHGAAISTYQQVTALVAQGASYVEFNGMGANVPANQFSNVYIAIAGTYMTN